VRRLLSVVALGACGATPAAVPAPPQPRSAVEAGEPVARCGPAVPPPAPPPRAEPRREPVPATLRGPASPGVAIDGAVPDVEGDLSAEVVSDGIRGGMDGFRACFLRQTALDLCADALRVQLAFVIVEDGSVGDVRVSGGPAALDACLCDRATALRFRPFDGRANVRYPLLFARSSEVVPPACDDRR
jgi:hypothetical protein